MKSPKLVLFLPLFSLCASTLVHAEPKDIVFSGCCDASAAAALDSKHVVVADDEQSTLRIYELSGGQAVSEIKMDDFIGSTGGKKKKPQEVDIEAAAQIGTRTYWVGSHGRNSKGKEAPPRQQIFATETKTVDGQLTLEPVGKPYADLLRDLFDAPQLKKYNLEEASRMAPKKPGALNIEGLAETPEGGLLIGFRNPIPQGKAIVVPLLNPADIIEGKSAKIGEPIELDLGGLGIRSLGRLGDRYIIIAGAFDVGEGSKLFTWKGGEDKPEQVEGVDFPGLNPEAVTFATEGDRTKYLILSDDGTLSVDGQDCKRLKDASLKKFRGRLLDIGS